MISIGIALAGTAALAALAFFGVRMLKGPSPGAEVPDAARHTAWGLLIVAMLAAFAFPFAARLPNMLWWLAPTTVAGVVLETTRRRKRFRRGPLVYAAFMLLTAGMVELVFWLGGSVFGG